jgi:hypothetical protein
MVFLPVRVFLPVLIYSGLIDPASANAETTAF